MLRNRVVIAPVAKFRGSDKLANDLLIYLSVQCCWQGLERALRWIRKLDHGTRAESQSSRCSPSVFALNSLLCSLLEYFGRSGVVCDLAVVCVVGLRAARLRALDRYNSLE